MSGIQPTTVIEAGQIIAEASGLSWCDDRKEVLDIINRIREEFYMNPDYPYGLFSDRYQCVELSEFPLDCQSCCSCCGDTYYGFTIPDDIDGVLAVWSNNRPLRMFSRWWENKTQINTKDCGPPMTTVLVGETFATQRSLPCPSEISFKASKREDNGKTVYATLLDENGDRVEIAIKLEAGKPVIPAVVAQGIIKVVLPDLVGNVVLSTADGYVLSDYSPYETVPCYRVIKVNVKCQDQVLIQGNQKFRPVYYDNDIVEVGSRRILELAARMLSYGETGTDDKEIQRAALDEARLKKLLKGAMDRQRGNSDQDPNPMVRRSLINGPKLNGYRARRGGCNKKGFC